MPEFFNDLYPVILTQDDRLTPLLWQPTVKWQWRNKTEYLPRNIETNFSKTGKWKPHLMLRRILGTEKKSE